MKWIGQHIVNFIARFRSDVYLEDLSTTTETSVLVVDSDGKVSKSTSLADDIIEAEIDTLGILTIDVDRSAAQGNAGADDITALHVDFDRTVPTSGIHNHRDLGIDLDVTSAGLGTHSVKGMDIDVVGTTDGTSTATGIDLNVSGADTNYGIQVLCEGEQLRLSHNSADYATFTVADTGDLTIETVGDGTTDSDLILDADGSVEFQPADGKAAKVRSTKTSAADAGAILQLICDDGAALGDDHRLGSLKFMAKENSATLRSGASIEAFADAAWSTTENGTRLEFYTMDGDNNSELSLTLDSDLLATFAGAVTVTGALTGTLATAAQTNITSLGTLTALTVDDINLNSKTLTITGDTSDTFTIVTGAAGATTLTTTDAAAAAGHFEVAADGNITLDAAGDIALEAGGNDITLDSDTLIITSATSQRPRVDLVDTANDADGSRFRLIKNRGAAGQDDDLISALQFQSYNDAGTPELNTFGAIASNITDATDGQESGSMTLQVAAHGGGLENGLVLKSGSQDDEVDVDIGLGASSVVSIPGNVTAAGRLTGKQIQIISANFKDNQGTTETFIPLSAQPEEKTGFTNEQTILLMPSGGYVKEIIVRAAYSTYTSENIVYKIYRRPKNKKVNGSTQIGSDITVAAPTQNTTDDNNTRSTGDLGTTYGYTKWDMLGISMTHQSTGPAATSDKTYITVVLENDLNDLGY